MPAASRARRLEAQRAALSRCRACGGRVAGAVPIVSMARNPRVMLVGQAPGQIEKTSQRPFAGRAGKTLFGWLAQAGLTETMLGSGSTLPRSLAVIPARARADGAIEYRQLRSRSCAVAGWAPSWR